MERLVGKSIPSIAREYNIPSEAMIVSWAKKYKEHGKDGLIDRRSQTSDVPNAMKGRPKTKFNSIEEENKYLRLENEYLKKHVSQKRGCQISELNLWSSKNLK